MKFRQLLEGNTKPLTPETLTLDKELVNLNGSTTTINCKNKMISRNSFYHVSLTALNSTYNLQFTINHFFTSLFWNIINPNKYEIIYSLQKFWDNVSLYQSEYQSEFHISFYITQILIFTQCINWNNNF